MGKILIPGSGSGADLDVITAEASDVLAPKVIVDRDGEPMTGTLALSGNAQAGHVLAGEGFYTTNPKSKQIGTMTVNSLLSFSAQPYSGRQVLLKWQNPYAAAGKPYSGVVIKYATGDYPLWNAGPALYSGAGDNVTQGGLSQMIVDMPNINTLYYFTAFAYAVTSAGDMYAPQYNPAAIIHATAATQADLWLTFAGSQEYIIPQGYIGIDLFAVGGGGGGGYGSDKGSERVKGGGGGGGGYTSTVRNISVSPGQVMAITVGAGGKGGKPSYVGGASCVVRDGTVLINANGGHSCPNLYSWGQGGGSGGGSGTYSGGDQSQGGGSDGSDGIGGPGAASGEGQHTSTRAWGEGAGTLYSGGGGGGSSISQGIQHGGAGGGGAGGRADAVSAAYGAPNTGGGGGGDAWARYGTYGGSGIVLLHLY